MSLLPEDMELPAAESHITREALADGSLLARLRALRLPGLNVRSDEEIEASLDEILAAHPPGTDAFVFGYGSLMWNPAFLFARRTLATLHGWHRRFCLEMTFGRGTPERPGLMMALDHGGSCHGIAFRIAAERVREELLLVWRREMSGTAYHARWVTLRTANARIRAVAFVINRAHPRYVGRLTEAEIAAVVARAHGPIGSNASYLRQAITALAVVGVVDHSLERLAAKVRLERHADRR
ncbi:MAG TPA: gamma-glutamylcyclotransferase [Acetobacteraceae bacterium]|nr:gamma-glutamylcyclotransferase [Acetobacteraceae bacterium]